MFSQPTMSQPIACPPMRPSPSTNSTYSYSSPSSYSTVSDESSMSFLDMYHMMGNPVKPEQPKFDFEFEFEPSSLDTTTTTYYYGFHPTFVYTPDAFTRVDTPPTSYPSSTTPIWSPTQLTLDQAMFPPLESLTSEPTKPAKPYACEDCGKSFTRPADLKRHQSTVHYPVFQNCPVADCSRKDTNGFPRRDHLVEHLRSYHHMDVPKRRSTKRVKVA